MTSRKLLSLVILVYNEEEILEYMHQRVTEVAIQTGLAYEIILVNDGSYDRSWSIMQSLQKEDPHLVLVNLSRNFGHQIAITAGMDHAQGDAVVIMDADLQDPPEVILKMIEKWQEGYDVVYGQRTTREKETFFKKATATLFYRFLSMLTTVTIPKDTGDFRLISRRAVNAMNNLQERHRFVRGLFAWIGYRQIGVTYERHGRAGGMTKYTLPKMLRLALDAIVSFSTVPLKLATLLGFLMSLGSFIYILYAIYVNVVHKTTVPGWTSTVVFVLFVGGIQCICLGIIGMYLGRMYEEVKKRPLYFVQDCLRQTNPSAAEGKLSEVDEDKLCKKLKSDEDVFREKGKGSGES